MACRFISIVVLLLALLNPVLLWVPPGMSERVSEQAAEPVDHDTQQEPQEQHHHHQSVDVADVVMDKEHLVDEFGELFSEKELELMDLDEQLFLWFSAHDWDEDARMDGLELFKALSHDHNYHHAEEDEPDPVHDPAQHSPPANRQRLRRTEKIVDLLLVEDDSDQDGALSFAEFVSAFRAGKMEGLKVKKTKWSSNTFIEAVQKTYFGFDYNMYVLYIVFCFSWKKKTNL